MSARYSLVSYLAGATSARMGDDMSGPALLLLAFAVSGSSSSASFVFGGLSIAAGIGGPFFGVALDRSVRPGRTLAGAIVAYALGLALVAVLLGHVPVIVVVGCAAVIGLLTPALAGGWTSQLHAVARPGALVRAHALDAATYNVASLAGPALAAAVTAAWGAAWAVVIAVFFLLAAAPLAWSLPRNQQRHPPLPGAVRGSVIRELRAGFAAISGVPGLRAITAGSCTAYLGIGMFVVACPVLGQQHLGSPGHGALLLSVVAAGALLTTSVIARWPPSWPPERTFLAATALAAVALSLTGFATTPAVLVTGAALLGMAEGPQLTSVFTIRQRDAPARLRGQIFTTAASLKLTAGAIGSLTGGILLAHSTTATLLVAAATQLAAVLASLIARHE